MTQNTERNFGGARFAQRGIVSGGGIRRGLAYRGFANGGGFLRASSGGWNYGLEASRWQKREKRSVVDEDEQLQKALDTLTDFTVKTKRFET
uniref:DUF1604 domain-containing protein n=1 Tax=Globodera pallida TaxID=36090 RepID=A0A183CGY8_GLOPA